MENPSTVYINVTDVPALVFSGCGTVNLLDIAGGGVVYGNASVTFGNTVNRFFFDGSPLTFKADAEIYAIRPSGQSGNVAVTRWF